MGTPSRQTLKTSADSATRDLTETLDVNAGNYNTYDDSWSRNFPPDRGGNADPEQQVYERIEHDRQRVYRKSESGVWLPEGTSTWHPAGATPVTTTQAPQARQRPRGEDLQQREHRDDGHADQQRTGAVTRQHRRGTGIPLEGDVSDNQVHIPAVPLEYDRRRK